MTTTLLSLIATTIIVDIMWFEFAFAIAALIQFVAIDLTTDLMSFEFDFVTATLTQAQFNPINPLELYVF